MKESMKKYFRSVLSLVLVAAMVLMFAGCGQKEGEKAPEKTEKTFTFEVVDLDGTKTSSVITTDASTVGEVLIEKGLISGSQSDYGIMVDTVNGIKYDYNEDGAYWAFNINGEYAMSGVDTTEIVDGAKYSFVATEA